MNLKTFKPRMAQPGEAETDEGAGLVRAGRGRRSENFTISLPFLYRESRRAAVKDD
jgi:hypothetical protein